ncbi:uncharacterized protein LACBIDRAFT_309105 [Laccaria bicolor S238N-H82]|uniref:Predicted protein n=1 Tax=Laccaria bicolor (strain S238N-H82 / ATCC MYA-4686) TaxID=486041 RepID=B0CVK1_LACBS|nr:uncharacterized protein LACBIDRAFT_309105 [Laccaria bicolor S238N-H82]EDR13346.1 predicted protein [Laccaria bicolor S238N-H82]|eukprot:XP_001875844.1 predicted protein [Laccaria bicolor S238N-H82]
MKPLTTWWHRQSNSQPNTNISKWTRPSPKPIDVERDLIVFQHIDIQEGKGRRPTIQLFGITQDGHTLLAHVQDFRHYFYFPSPEGITDDDLKPIKDALNDALKAENGIPIVDDIQRTREYPRQDERKKDFLKIFFPNPQIMKAVRDKSNIRPADRHGFAYTYFQHMCLAKKDSIIKTSFALPRRSMRVKHHTLGDL